jgi:plastocyanin
MRRRLLLTSLGIALAGCSGTETEADGGDGEDGGTGPTDTATTTETATAATGTATATATPTATGTETATATGTATPTATETATPTAAQTVTVAADGKFRFAPESFDVAAGETVRWVWRGGGHNVVAASTPDGADWSGTPGAPDELYDSGYEYERAFDVTGTYEYYCAPHRSLDMVGSFTVV